MDTEYVCVNGESVSFAEMVAMDKTAIKTVVVWNCPALAVADWPAATSVSVRECPALAVGKWFYAGTDDRGLGFLGNFQTSVPHVWAESHKFTIPKALSHWGPGGESDRPDCFALVKKIESESIKRAANPKQGNSQ